MKRYLISIFISIACIASIIFENYRLAEMYNKSTGKTRALFGITEFLRLDIKLYIGVGLLMSFILGILAIRRNENRKLSILSIVLSVISIILLFIRLWAYFI